MKGHWDVGAAVPIVALLLVDKLRTVRLRNSFAVSVLAFAVGVFSLFGKRR